MTLQENVGVNRFTNNFDLLRFTAATMVIFDHTYFWLGLSQFEFLASITKNMTFGGLGVSIFFVISGYLITKSWDRTKSLSDFFWSRILRIIPALAVATLFVILVVGPLTTNLGFIDYIINAQTWAYLRVITIYGWIDVLPGVMHGVNGVLWTIPIEFTMYILIGIIGFVGFLYRRHVVLMLFLITTLIYGYLITWPAGTLLSFIKLPFVTPDSLTNAGALIDFTGLTILFLAGALFYIYRTKIHYDAKTAGILLFIIVICDTLFLMGVPYFSQASALSWHILLPYLILFLAFLPVKKLNYFGRIGDFSYGLYIYGWPIQLLITSLFGAYLNFITGFIAFYSATLLMAYFSWNLIEKRALGLKNLKPHDALYAIKKYMSI